MTSSSMISTISRSTALRLRRLLGADSARAGTHERVTPRSPATQQPAQAHPARTCIRNRARRYPASERASRGLTHRLDRHGHPLRRVVRIAADVPVRLIRLDVARLVAGAAAEDVVPRLVGRPLEAPAAPAPA